ncbi:LysR family transcriptional regulator [Massilia sp. YIM B02763]|uniref:LysR family transcriptional regulator n=1 Tax=Massilia sp. YIM B02763 TaxID=3050130 RepID=UPI0025B66FBE|nr:LysR family transcriptional regulator [Massilia sp. YIM B02763]
MDALPLRHADFRRIDLNLLVAFDALMAERHVGRAAARLFIGQPAMSHALARLREALGDPLFVRAGNRMEPSALALELGPRVHDWLEQAHGFLFAREQVDLAQVRATVKLGLIAGLEAMLLPPLMQRANAVAPGLRLWSRQFSRNELPAAIDAEDVDLALWVPEPGQRDWHGMQHLVRCGFDAVYARSQVRPDGPMTLDAAVRYPQVALGWRGEEDSIVDEVIAARGLQRNVIALSDSQLATARLLATMPVVSLQPRIYSGIYRDMPDMVVAPLDIDELGMDIGLLWHRRREHDPVLGFVRGAIAAIVQGQAGPQG